MIDKARGPRAPAPEPRRSPPLSDVEKADVERLRREGKPDGYIRGWLVVGRRLARLREQRSS